MSHLLSSGCSTVKVMSRLGSLVFDPSHLHYGDESVFSVVRDGSLWSRTKKKNQKLDELNVTPEFMGEAP